MKQTYKEHLELQRILGYCWVKNTKTGYWEFSLQLENGKYLCVTGENMKVEVCDGFKFKMG